MQLAVAITVEVLEMMYRDIVKIVPNMSYNVFGEMLNVAQSRDDDLSGVYSSHFDTVIMLWWHLNQHSVLAG